MATDPLNPMAPLGLNWGAVEQPVDPAPVPSGSLDTAALEALAAGPQLDPRASATQTRTAGVEGATSVRAERLESASAHRRALLGGDPAALEREALARTAGNMSRVDTTTLPSDQEFALEANIYAQQWGNADVQSAERTTGEALADTGLAIGKGLTTGLGSLGTLGAAFIDPELGISVAQGTHDAAQWFDGFQSETLAERGRLTRIENELDREDNELRRLQDIRDGSTEFMAGIRQVGRDFLSTLENYSVDPGQMGNISAEGLGSLVGSAGIGGLIMRLVSRGITREASRQLAERAVMGGVIGMMEGGDAYGNAALEVMNMSEETLKAQSDEYRGLRAAGFSHEEAQIELAHESGMTAAAITAPASAVAGALVGRFEAAPLSFRGAGVADVARTTAAQFAEETFQEGMTQFSGNVGLRWSGADPNRDLTVGVGEAGAMGGIGGAGMAAGLRGATAAVRAPAQIIAGVGAAGEAVGRVADAREERNFQRNSPVSDAAISEALAQAAPAQQRVAEAVQNTPPVQEAEPDPVKERAKAELEFLMNIGDDELNTLMPNVRDVISGRYRADGLFALVQELDGDRLTQKEKDQALLYIKARLPTIDAVVSGSIREQAESLYSGMGIAEDIDTMAGSIGQMIQNPKVAQALGIELTQEQIDSLTENSPENTVMAAEVAPTMVDPARAREALNHSTNGTLRVNPQAIRFLAMSADLGDLIQEYKGTLDQTFGSVASEGTNRVRAEALVTGRTNRKELSMVQHIDRISSDFRNGQLEEAKANMEEFKLFVDGQRNKLNAMEQSKKNNDGNAVSYARNTPMGWAAADSLGSGKVTYLLGKGAEKSENLLQNMRADTLAMERAYARVAEAFPEMQAAPVEPPQGRRSGLKDLEIEAQDEIIQQETEAKSDKPYRPRKGTVLPTALGSLVERNVSEETAQSIATKIDLHMDDDGRVLKSKFTSEELKVFRDTYGIPIHHKTIRVPDDLAEQTRAVREELARIEDERQIELPLEEPAQPAPKKNEKEAQTPLEKQALDLITNFLKGIKASGKLDLTNHEVAEEAADVASLLSVFNLTPNPKNTEPSKMDVVRSMQQLMQLINENSSDNNLSQSLSAMFDWVPVTEIDEKRVERAKKHASKYGKDNVNRHLLFQMLEETVEVLSAANNEENMLIKAAFKMVRFGENTMIKDGPNKGKTNGQVFSEQLGKNSNADGQIQEGEIVSEEVPEVTLSDLVPKTNERFRNAYSLRKDGSKLLAQTSPIEAVRNQIMSSNKGGVLNEAWNRLLNLSGKMTQQMNKKLRQDKTAQDFIQKLKAGHVFKSGNTVLDTAAGRSLALLDQETEQFESRIAEVGGLAFVHWLMNERKPDINRLDDTDVAGIFRISPDDVTQAMTDVVASGNYIENAVASLADTITKFAGLAPVNGVSRSDAGGIVLGLATELMDAAIELGLISISDQTVEINRNGKTENWPYRAVIIDNETVLTFQSNMTQSGELSTLEEIIVPDADKAFYIGEPPTKIDPTQMKNRETELTAREKKAIQKEQNKPSFVNTPFVNLMKAIGRDNWLTLMGYQDVSDSVPMNPQHRKSVEGKNTSLVYGWDGVMGHVAAVDRYAAENQMAQDEVPSFWAYGISLVGRLQQRGFGPQGDKQAREALTATIATLDLTDPAQDDRFWMTVAQSIGVKTEKVFRANAVAKAKKMMSHPLAEEAQGILFGLVQNPEGTLSDNESKALLSLFAEMADRDSKSGFGPANPKLIHAFLAVARYWDAKENGTDTAFKHNLSLESDGKTDGPINAIMNFLSGSFNATQLMLMSMGGFFVNRVNKTLNSHFMDGGKDLYEHTSELLEGRIQTMLATMEPQPKAALETVLKLLSVTGNVSYADGKLTIGRGVVKNPLTVSVYGAGETGIAGKVTREVMDAVYEQFTKSLTGTEDVQDLVNQLSSLVNNKIVYSKKKGKYFVFPAEHKSPIGKVDASKFVLNSEQYAQLRDNIKVLFSDPMVDSINEMMGATKKTMSLMQQSTQVQAIIAQERFRNRVAEIKANKKPGEDLSEKEYFEVFKEIAPYGAQIFMPDQSANIGVSEKLGAYNPDPNKRDTDMVRALGNDRVSGNLKTIQPSDAGVKAAPFMVIMTGDAKMILYLAADGLVKTLMVFDGVEMAADMMDEQSYVINKAVALGWSQDSSAAVADSFENFMRQNPMATPLSDEAAKALDWALTGERDAVLDTDTRKSLVQGLQERLRNTSDEIRARKETLQEFGYSVDHMASAEQPYSEGANRLLKNEDGTPLDDAILVQRMNEVYTEKLNQIKKDRGERQTREAKNTGLVSLVQEGAAAVRGRKGGAVSLSVSQMFEAVKTAKNSHQRAMLHAALTALRKSGYTFHFGSREELVKLRETLSPGIDQALDLGQTDPVGKHVYVASATTETALHEAIHAATIDKVFSALTDPENTPVAIRESVDRLGLLMEEFMGFDFTQLAGDQAGLDAQATIDAHLKKGTEAGRVYAINEFMAWSLSNQHLIEIMQRTKVRNPLARVAFKVMRVIKGLLGMGGIPDNMYQNIRFNTQVILNESMEMDSNAQAALDHTVNADAHTALVMKRFNNVFRHYMNNLKVEDFGLKSVRRSMKAKVQAELNQKVNRVADTFQAAGFNFSAQQQQAFKSIQRAMMTEVEMHKPSLLRAQTMFRHVLDNLKPEHFMVNPQSTNPNDIRDAQDKFNAITGAYGIQRDIAGRSSLLGSFLALSQVDPQFREILRNMKPPKGDGASPVATSRFDELATTAFNELTDRLASVMYDGPNRGSSVGQTIDNLIEGLSTIQSDSRTLVEKSYDTFMNKAENKSVELIQSGIDGGIEALDRIKQNSKNRIVRSMAEAAKAVASLGSNRYSEVYANALTTIFNNDRTPIVVRDFFDELRGTNTLNENLHNMMGKVKYEVSATRQDFLEVLPHTILNQFKSKMGPEQWASLSRSVAATDLGNLMSRYSLNTVRELVSDGRKLNGAIAATKSRLQAKDRVHALAYETKAEALATYMITGEITSKNLLTNAVAISRLLGERKQPPQTPDQETIDMIDDLVSLLALSKVQKADRDYLADRLTNETEGMDFMLRYINELDRRERAKTTNQRAIFNQIKGRMDTVRSGSDQIIVAEESEFKRLARIGYTRLADYKGDSNDRGIRAYFYSPVKGQSTYHQGVMQTVQSTSYGVDSHTGYMVGNTGGRITGAAAKRIAKDLANQKKDNLAPGEYLKPVYNERGEMVAFERMLSPEMLSKIKKDDHLATRIGAWRGRQAEEGLAHQFNTGLVGVLHDYWNNEKHTRNTEYVNLADPQNRDAVLNHIWSVIPKEMKTEIGQVFGFDADGNPIFMVRRDMLNNALGYPGASVGDFFTGKNRINPQVNEAIRKGLTAIMGPPAYQWLVQTERGWQSAVSATKATIVIRSVVVPFANIISNIMQMLLRRVPLRYFGKPLMHKVHETNVFLRNKVRLAELEAQGIAARGDIQRVAALRAKYRAIEDENKRLSIWPLIDRGEFASIADGLSEADKVVDNHRLMDMIENQVNKLPEGVRTAGKYAIVSRDTALFKLLNRSVQYGDFIAKALVYDHKLSQGNSPEDAYRAIRNEFVNYNLLPGRVRTTLEGLGLLWFWNFKIRIVKVALDTLRNNPLTALLWSMSPIRDLPIEGINDGPLTDNLFWKGLMDKLHHSMGPGMISMLFESNPWVRFIGN